MRSLWLMAAVSLMLAAPASAGIFQLRMSKPDTTYAVFLDDVAACNSTIRRDASWPVGYHVIRAARIEANQAKFLSCLVAKGYRADPHGYRTVKIYYRVTPPKYDSITP